METPFLKKYLKSPCRTASIPYWKQKNLVLPDNMKIVHDEEFAAADYADYTDEIYFRLLHDLNYVNGGCNSDAELVFVGNKLHQTLDIFADIINESYDDVSVTKDQLFGDTEKPEHCPDLWVLLRDKTTGKFVGSGIADYDPSVGEAGIEWAQVLPAFRRRGYAEMIVNGLLTRMQGKAKFATVSGKARSPYNVESLYRKCGFTGGDVWHVLRKKTLFNIKRAL